LEYLPVFKGVTKIASLKAYPLRFDRRKDDLKDSLLRRGKKWAALAGGLHHMHYVGIGGSQTRFGLVKYNIHSRVMIDRSNFSRLNPNYMLAEHTGDFQQEKPDLTELTEDDLIITSPIVYGFSLSDKIWLELDVEKVSDIVWDEDAFTNLVIPQDRKILLQSLVEAHNIGADFDDFIKGKGRGLVINLFGPPGVGKTFTAEATSEYVKKPLYVVGSGDLGTTAGDLDSKLQRVFDLAAAWKAIVLIDEADVFLEERSLHDLERNAMVAVFLRHLEYYPAILFLTTNRVKAFDHAFLSRIHIALHFQDLSEEALRSIWEAFLTKAGLSTGSEVGVSKEELDSLAKRSINGRQVKNAVKTAISLALSRGETVSYSHLLQVLDVMETFQTEYQEIKP